jgi:hypothetical protein
MHRVGLAIPTRNAAPLVKDKADIVTGASGGSGAAREAVELILKTQGLWTEILQSRRSALNLAGETGAPFRPKPEGFWSRTVPFGRRFKRRIFLECTLTF